MLEKNANDLELKLRIVRGEIRESKREKERCLDNVIGIITAFICLLGGISFYYFFNKKELGTVEIILSVILLLLCLVFGPYWHNKYKKKKKKQIEKLEKELGRLKEEG